VIVTHRASPFIRQFDGPGDNGIICFKFWQAVIASGCPGECAYCFLQTQTPYRRGLYDLSGTMFSNLEEIVPETLLWLRQPHSAGLIVGENQDGLAFERPYKHLLGFTPLELLVPLFADKNPHDHTLIILSKFTTTEFAEALGPNPNVVFSWSLSLPSITRRYEKKVASLRARLGSARRLKSDGWRIRFRLDALAPVEDWEGDLAEIVGEINDVGPEMVTIGALRATNLGKLRGEARRNRRDDTVFDHLREKDPSGFKYRVEHEFHVSAFKRVAELLDPSIRLGLCKEDASLWQEVGLHWNGCHCLSGPQDEVVSERGEPFQLVQEMATRSHRSCQACTPVGGDTPPDSRGMVHQLRLVPKRAERLPVVSRSAD
jgi:DNA repair photolyase